MICTWCLTFDRHHTYLNTFQNKFDHLLVKQHWFISNAILQNHYFNRNKESMFNSSSKFENVQHHTHKISRLYRVEFRWKSSKKRSKIVNHVYFANEIKKTIWRLSFSSILCLSIWIKTLNHSIWHKNVRNSNFCCWFFFDFFSHKSFFCSQFLHQNFWCFDRSLSFNIFVDFECRKWILSRHQNWWKFNKNAVKSTNLFSIKRRNFSKDRKNQKKSKWKTTKNNRKFVCDKHLTINKNLFYDFHFWL